MKTFLILRNKITECFNSFCITLTCLYSWCQSLFSTFLCIILLRINTFWIQLHYFLTLSLLGYLSLKISEQRTTSFRPKDFDLLFTSVSAATVSSMASVEMEAFSNSQQMFLSILIILGGQIFTSMLELQLKLFKLSKMEQNENRVDSSGSRQNLSTDRETGIKSSDSDDIKYKSMKCLGFVVLSYFLVVQVSGFTLVSLYVWLNSSAGKVLMNKGLNVALFSYFATVSSFANCGFLPTNENMVVFKKNTGLHLILIPQILLGNTLYPVFLRLMVMVLKRVKNRVEFDYMLRNGKELGYYHLLPGMHSCCLGVTALGFVLIQLVLFVGMQWNSEATDGLNSYEKAIGSLFQVVNSRHTGESVFDLSLVSPAIIVFLVAMMYLPSYSHFLLCEDDGSVPRTDKKGRTKWKNSVDFLILSPLPFLVILVALICITERDKMQKDPLNFNVLNIVFEVISAYGNVGFSLGYSCKRQLVPEGNCKDAWYGFAGRWSTNGKLVLILVMIFGRLRKFHKKCGRGWKLS